ncbi:MAG: DUF2281 domain-containing protein [Calditrichaeota bacterium]|nr:MAG: DUF2281 domain-containing protein [Calditrichota bacterium]
MSYKEAILKEIENIPEELLKEVLMFIQFLKFKINQEEWEILLASESALKKDWLRSEEDEAWRDL